MTWFRKHLLIFGGAFFFMSALQIVRCFAQPSDIWWTPKAIALPLAGTSDRVEVYVRGVALRDHVEAGRLQLVTDSGATAVAGPDIRLRVNNWDRIRAERIPVLLGHAAALGASGVFFLIGLLGWAPPRRSGRAGPAGTGHRPAHIRIRTCDRLGGGDADVRPVHVLAIHLASASLIPRASRPGRSGRRR